MRTLSTCTRLDDPYRAGLALGTALRPVAPEVVFLFSTVHYGQPPELLEGLYDGLDNESVLVIGNSGDGFYESGEVSDHGVAALGLNGEGRLRFRLATEASLGEDPEGAARRAWASLQSGGEKPALVFLAADFRTDATRIEAVLHDEIDVPVVGGLAADDNRMQNCLVFAGRQMLDDSLVMLGVYGPLRFEIAIGNSLSPVGRAGLIEAAEGTSLNRIDGLSAADFVERETGKPVLESDRGIVTLSIANPERPGEKRLRSIMRHAADAEGSISLYGGIETGKSVRVCRAHPADLIAEVQAIAERATQLDFAPKAALIVSCVGRKWLLNEQIEHEVRELSQSLGRRLPLAGYPSFGEIGPLKDEWGYTPNLFHNMTYVLLLLGD
ncbi:MAG: FIST C-terminal domain-containing protein [Gammaproteobacteria bacterium]|nr:FIST C-terminal domain-containing protein [Gammaproteobacteria bacterium]